MVIKSSSMGRSLLEGGKCHRHGSSRGEAPAIKYELEAHDITNFSVNAYEGVVKVGIGSVHLMWERGNH